MQILNLNIKYNQIGRSRLHCGILYNLKLLHTATTTTMARTNIRVVEKILDYLITLFWPQEKRSQLKTDLKLECSVEYIRMLNILTHKNNNTMNRNLFSSNALQKCSFYKLYESSKSNYIRYTSYTASQLTLFHVSSDLFCNIPMTEIHVLSKYFDVHFSM